LVRLGEGLFGITPIANSQISITIGLFVLVISSNIEKYQTLLWVIVIQEIEVIIIHIYQIMNGDPDFFNDLTILVIYSIYAAVILLLTKFPSTNPEPI
jgi:hypothetical protein